MTHNIENSRFEKDSKIFPKKTIDLSLPLQENRRKRAYPFMTGRVMRRCQSCNLRLRGGGPSCGVSYVLRRRGASHTMCLERDGCRSIPLTKSCSTVEHTILVGDGNPGNQELITTRIPHRETKCQNTRSTSSRFGPRMAIAFIPSSKPQTWGKRPRLPRRSIPTPRLSPTPARSANPSSSLR